VDAKDGWIRGYASGKEEGVLLTPARREMAAGKK
jgi:hypothetical protein